MAETRPTPGPWRYETDANHEIGIWGQHDREQLVAEILDLSRDDDANARLIVSSCNAVQSLATHLNTDPVALAKVLEDGGLVELVEASERALKEGSSFEQVGWEPTGLSALRALLDKIRSAGK